MKVFQNNCTFDYPWASVSIANWRKYCAWNTQSTHVLAVDTLDRSVDPHTGILRTERLITCSQNAPKWLLKMMNAEVSYVREVSEVDPRTKTVTLRSVNLTGCNMVSVQETVVYSPDPNAPETKTLFTQEASITAFAALSRLRNTIEEWSVERFGQNAQKGRVGFEAVLEMSAKAFRDMKDGSKNET